MSLNDAEEGTYWLGGGGGGYASVMNTGTGGIKSYSYGYIRRPQGVI